MKSIFSTIIVCFCIVISTGPVHSQTDSLLTRLEQVLLAPNTLLKKEFRDIGKVKNVNVTFVALTNLENGATQSGIKVSANGYTAFIDTEEIPQLLRSFDVIIKSTSDMKYDNVEYHYRSSGGLIVACSKELKPPSIFDKNKAPQDLEYFIVGFRYISEARAVSLNRTNFIKVIDLIRQAK